MNSTKIQNQLDQCTGTTHYFKHWLTGVYTDGVKEMADLCNAYWLIDLVMSYQTHKIKTIPFQLWTLTVKDNVGIATMREDSDQPILVQQEIPFTDFPLDEIKFYFIDGVLLLPNEY